MARRDRIARKQFTAVHTLCSIVFCVLTFTYLYYYQGEVLALAQHVLSGGATTYDKFVGASVITIVLFLVHVFVYSLVRLDRWFYWLTYLPSYLILAILTDVSIDNTNSVYNYAWLWVAPLIIIVYIGMVRLFAEVDNIGKDSTTFWFFSKVSWINLLCTSIMMLIVVSVCGTDITLHNRIKVESCIINGDYEEALNVGKEYTETDESLTMLRAYTLAMQGKLAERLFEYPLKGGSKALCPNGKDIKSLMIHSGDIVKFIHSKTMQRHNISQDYQLCGDLLDCRLNDFKDDLKKYYKTDSLLPKHYKEAIVLYNDLHSKDTINMPIVDSAMIIAYKDFKELTSKHTDREQNIKTLKIRFSDTYWLYYFMQK